ncbi:hypothetical protein PAXINDRAFT_99401 [Paxillus involutus ATCC 200175]|uniref:Uncharacterized protein n=1 Tax=Paxillus involutus ATCC 200175 TaxID=664439 RepID=A0A0C9TYW1_PAXIN|nr:hypothetical protein PAXINDRAFT_99401 [Paxillus involutus ATCC 200175]
MLVNNLKFACRQAGRRVAQWKTFDVVSRPGSYAGLHGSRFSIDDAPHETWEGNDIKQAPRTIQVRFSVVPESMVDALRGLREIERKYGRIREYRLLRDSELSSAYQAICWAAFESPKSFDRVPERGVTLKVSLPPALGQPEGGPGLDDLKGLLEPGKTGLDFRGLSSSYKAESSENSRTMEVTVKRSNTAIRFRSNAKPPYRSRAMKASIGHAFLEWGGFAPLKPLYESSPFTSPAQDPLPLDNKNMRMALNKWSQILDVPDPLFPEMRPEQTRPNETEENCVTVPTPASDPPSSRRSKSLASPAPNASKKAKVDDEWEPLSESIPISPMEVREITGFLKELDLLESGGESFKQSAEDILEDSRLQQSMGETGLDPPKHSTKM